MNSIALICFSTINNISISVSRSYFTLVFSKAAFHTYPGAERKWVGSSSYTSRHIFRKLLNTSASNNVSLWTSRSWNSSKFFILKSLRTPFYVRVFCMSNVLHILMTVKIFFSGIDVSLNFSQSSIYSYGWKPFRNSKKNLLILCLKNYMYWQVTSLRFHQTFLVILIAT